MNIKLSKDENLIRTWDYASYKKGGKFFKKEHHDVSLTLTSKRIITLDTSERSSEYEEIPLDSVISVNCKQYRKNIFGLVLGIIFSVVALITGIVLSIMFPSVGIGLLVIAVCLLIFFIIRLGQGSFILTLKTNTIDGLEITLGENSYIKKGESGIFKRIIHFFFGKKVGKRKMKINFADVNDMCETIGAIILDHKQAA